MTELLYETLRRIVREEMARVRTSELAVVEVQHPHASASDDDNYACTVRLRDTDLVLSRVPVATQRVGTVSIPAVGELVLVQFIGGDINAPVITGRLYNDADRPPVSADDGHLVAHLPLAASDEDAVHWEVRSGSQREISLKLAKAVTARIRDDDPVMDLDVDGGKATLSIARDGAVTLETGGAVSVKSSGKVSLEGSDINIEASGKLVLKGATVDIN